MGIRDNDPLHSRGEPTAIILLNDHSIKLLSKYLSLYLQVIPIELSALIRNFLLQYMMVNLEPHN